jgi:hypothetical protein
MVPLVAGASYLNSFEPAGGLKTRITSRAFNKFHVQLMDFDNNVLNLSSLDWAFAITLYSKEDIVRKRSAESDDFEDHRPLKDENKEFEFSVTSGSLFKLTCFYRKLVLNILVIFSTRIILLKKLEFNEVI